MGRWRRKASKTRFGCKTFYFVRKSSWGISEPPGAFGSKPAPWRCGLFIVLAMQGRPVPVSVALFCSCTDCFQCKRPFECSFLARLSFLAITVCSMFGRGCGRWPQPADLLIFFIPKWVVNHKRNLLISISILRMNAGTMCIHVRKQLQ